ncbi:DUF881 domain-containing protein [Aeromicrobium sp. IC_218]|uniref:DUF881 domain-containing protein n=1 Tax=Aeromicrobium sp. IC_218 TaxID=2545468 RepID=UPI00103B08E3|nr:DUF881 domain-containing protein [Aeromicrobium sp. IC_218]TCI95959.1 DUF881 domain-containing protein [Aeromicrobium sp. IC_218]
MPEPRRRKLVPQLVVAVLLGGLAFAVTVQVRGNDSEAYSTLRQTELVELLRSLDAANERASQQVDELTRTRDELASSSQQSQAAQRQADKRATQLGILAGTLGARGPGVELTITDPEDDVNAAILLDAVEELRDAGAEAIVVNGTARVVAQTYFVDEGDEVRVGGRTVTRPFVIEAIGDPDTLAEAMRIRGGLLDRVENSGGTLDIDTRDTVTITALADTQDPEYARPSS